MIVTEFCVVAGLLSKAVGAVEIVAAKMLTEELGKLSPRPLVAVIVKV